MQTHISRPTTHVDAAQHSPVAGTYIATKSHTHGKHAHTDMHTQNARLRTNNRTGRMKKKIAPRTFGSDSRRKQFDKYLYYYYKSNAPLILTAAYFFPVRLLSNALKKKIICITKERDTTKNAEHSARWFFIRSQPTTIVRDPRFVHMCAPEICFFFVPFHFFSTRELVNFAACLLRRFSSHSELRAGLG